MNQPITHLELETSRVDLAQQRKAYRDNPVNKAKLKAYRSTPEYLARQKELRATPEYREKNKVYQSSPERKEKRKTYEASPEAQARIKAYRSTPEYQARQRENRLKYYETHADQERLAQKIRMENMCKERGITPAQYRALLRAPKKAKSMKMIQEAIAQEAQTRRNIEALQDNEDDE